MFVCKAWNALWYFIVLPSILIVGHRFYTLRDERGAGFHGKHHAEWCAAIGWQGAAGSEDNAGTTTSYLGAKGKNNL